MDNANLTSTLQEMLVKMEAMQAELNGLKQRANAVTITQEVEQPARPAVSTTRRKVLRRLAGGLLTGLAVGSVAAAMPETVEASFVRSGGAGAIVMRPGGTVTGSLPATTFYGLIATPDSTLNIGAYSAGYTAGVLGTNAGTTNSFGLFGQSADTGVYGSGTKIGIRGNSNTGCGIQASSTTGTPFSIVPGADGGPTSGTPQLGDMYVNSIGHLFIYAFVPLQGYAWRHINFT